jgi:cbb3-type cytochrome oxidase subunit 3
MDTIFTIICSIIANLLTPYAQRFFPGWKFKVDEENKLPFPEPHDYQPDLTEEEKEHTRANNRAKFIQISQQAFLFGLPAFVLYFSLSMPFRLKYLGQQSFSFNDTRLEWLFGSTQISDAAVTVIVVALSLIIYKLCFTGAQKLSYHIGRFIDQWWKISASQFTGITVLSFIPISLFVSGQLVYLLYPKFSYGQSLIAPFLFIIAGLVFMFSNTRTNEQRS